MLDAWFGEPVVRGVSGVGGVRVIEIEIEEGG